MAGSVVATRWAGSRTTSPRSPRPKPDASSSSFGPSSSAAKEPRAPAILLGPRKLKEVAPFPVGSVCFRHSGFGANDTQSTLLVRRGNARPGGGWGGGGGGGAWGGGAGGGVGEKKVGWRKGVSEKETLSEKWGML